MTEYVVYRVVTVENGEYDYEQHVARVDGSDLVGQFETDADRADAIVDLAYEQTSLDRTPGDEHEIGVIECLRTLPGD